MSSKQEKIGTILNVNHSLIKLDIDYLKYSLKKIDDMVQICTELEPTCNTILLPDINQYKASINRDILKLKRQLKVYNKLENMNKNLQAMSSYDELKIELNRNKELERKQIPKNVCIFMGEIIARCPEASQEAFVGIMDEGANKLIEKIEKGESLRNKL